MNPLRQLRLEELMDIEGTSGSKKEQKLNEASAAFEAITIARRIVIVVSLKTPDDSDGLQALTNPSFRSAPEVPRSELGVIETLGHGGVRPPGELVDAPGP